jgi:hypothetical protein
MTKKIGTDESENFEILPAELDNETVIFSYGSLLDHNRLRELLTGRGPFKIHETGDPAEAALLARANPKDIVILNNVRLENVRVSIVTETILRRWYKNRGGEPEKLSEAETALFLYGRTAAGPREKGRTLNGWLICNLSREELSILDEYELKPVLTRTRAPKLKIGGRGFTPRHITFYAGTERADDITPEEKAERAGFLNLNRKPGSLRPQARWRKNVRRG